jgi:hypothetical protein
LANNIADLMPHFKYRKDKLKLLREVEIIIIDEVSMLRADVLDMMDFPYGLSEEIIKDLVEYRCCSSEICISCHRW